MNNQHENYNHPRHNRHNRNHHSSNHSSSSSSSPSYYNVSSHHSHHKEHYDKGMKYSWSSRSHDHCDRKDSEWIIANNTCEGSLVSRRENAKCMFY